MRKVKLYSVMIPFGTPQTGQLSVGDIISSDALKGGGISEIEMLEAGIIEENIKAAAGTPIPSFPLLIKGTINGKEICWRHISDDSYQYKSLVMSFVNLIEDERYGIEDEEELQDDTDDNDVFTIDEIIDALSDIGDFDGERVLIFLLLNRTIYGRA